MQRKGLTKANASDNIININNIITTATASEDLIMSKLVPKKKNTPLTDIMSNLTSQLEDVKTRTDESKGIATISGKKDGKIISATIEQSDIGKTQTASIYENLARKSDYKDEVKRLYKKGLKQNEIALRLGISQSLVSKLLNE